MHSNYLNNQLLIAMPQMDDPNFAKTVTLICEHNAEGALGIILNRPLSISVAEILEQFSLEMQGAKLNDSTVMGGPVATDRGFVLHSRENTSTSPTWESSLTISNDLQVTTSRDILEAIAKGEGPQDIKFALGYAGWEAGQLEEELLANAWLTAPCDNKLIFHSKPSECWEAAGLSIGINLHALSTHHGHA